MFAKSPLLHTDSEVEASQCFNTDIQKKDPSSHFRPSCQRIVIDIRSTSAGMASGIARFVTGLATGLVAELHARQQNSEQREDEKLKVLLVSDTAPTPWVINLVTCYPHVVSFWSGGLKLGRRKWKKLAWLWSTLFFRRVLKIVGSHIVWISPANSDRPLWVSRGPYSHCIIQVIHDCIPLLPHADTSLFFRWQFRLLVLRTLQRLPWSVATVSRHSASLLQNLVGGDCSPVVISDAVESIFGSFPRFPSREKCYEARKKFMLHLLENAPEDKVQKIQEFIKKIVCSRWTLGVGRSQKYKGWQLAIAAVLRLADSARADEGVVFLRVGAGEGEISFLRKRHECIAVGNIHFFPSIGVVLLGPGLSDPLLIQLYRLTDLLIHPSAAEGFGLPPLEAALSGTPVIFRAGTAVDSHFPSGSLPEEYWRSISSADPSVWADNIKQMLFSKRESSFFTALDAAEKPREFIIHSTGTDGFQWQDSARVLLEMINKINIKQKDKQAQESLPITP